MPTTNENRRPQFSEPIGITKQQLTYLAKAINFTDPYAKSLQKGLLFKREGKTWLAAIDRFRMHVVKVADHDNWRTEWPMWNGVLVDVRRLLFEVKYRGAKSVTLADDIVMFGTELMLEPIFSDPEKFPRIIPMIEEAVSGPARPEPIQHVAFNADFVKDAASMNGAKRATIHGLWHNNKALVIASYTDVAWKQDWFAIVMPMQSLTHEAQNGKPEETQVAA